MHQSSSKHENVNVWSFRTSNDGSRKAGLCSLCSLFQNVSPLSWKLETINIGSNNKELIEDHKEHGHETSL
jgi:hypothetical protein